MLVFFILIASLHMGGHYCCCLYVPCLLISQWRSSNLLQYLLYCMLWSRSLHLENRTEQPHGHTLLNLVCRKFSKKTKKNRSDWKTTYRTVYWYLSVLKVTVYVQLYSCTQQGIGFNGEWLSIARPTPTVRTVNDDDTASLIYLLW